MQWDTVEHFFAYLNKRICYAVLRSSEELASPGFAGSGKDIDLLCKDKGRLARLCGDARWSGMRLANNTISVRIHGEEIPVDIYEPGDGYYDIAWEKEMLRRRRKAGSGIYVLSDEDLFYSMAYHALFHNSTFKEKYRRKLLGMQVAGWDGRTETLREMLEDFMSERNYRYTYPLVPSYARFDGVAPGRIYKSFRVPVYQEIRRAQSVLHRIFTRG